MEDQVYDLAYLKGKTIKSIANICVEDDVENSKLSDSYLLTCIDGSQLQIVVDYQILIYKISTEKDIVVLGEYDADTLNVRVITLLELNPQQVNTIINYHQQSYHFGTKLLNKDDEYIFGFTFGFDEVAVINEKQFNKMVGDYAGVSSYIV